MAARDGNDKPPFKVNVEDFPGESDFHDIPDMSI